MLSMGVFSLFFCELEAHSQLCVSLIEKTKEVRLAILRLAMPEILGMLKQFHSSLIPGNHLCCGPWLSIRT